MKTLKSLALAAGLLGATALSAQAATESFSATIPTVSSTTTIFPYTYDFTLPGFDTSLGTLTGVELLLTNNASASVSVVNLDGVTETFTDATASVGLTVTGPDGISVTATYTAGPYNGTVPAAVYYPPGSLFPGSPGITSPGVTNIPGTTGTVTNSATSTDFSAFEGSSPVAFDYTASTDGGGYAGRGTTGVFFGGEATTGGAASVTYTYTDPAAPAAPELSTWAMMSLGFAGLGFAGFHSTRKSAAFGA